MSQLAASHVTTAWWPTKVFTTTHSLPTLRDNINNTPSNPHMPGALSHDWHIISNATSSICQKCIPSMSTTTLFIASRHQMIYMYYRNRMTLQVQTCIISSYWVMHMMTS